MINQLKLDVIHWVINWVSQYNEQLQAVPCPFAKNALIEGKCNWFEVGSADALTILLESFVTNGIGNEVAIIGMDRNSITPDNLSSLIKDVNVNTLMPNNLVALEDHPDDIEDINGVVMNQGKWILVLVQALDKLNHASDALKAQGYYKNWSQEAIDDVVSWRFKE